MTFKEFLEERYKNKVKFEVLIHVEETRRGLVTFSHPTIESMDTSYKAQLSQFLNDLIKRLK